MEKGTEYISDLLGALHVASASSATTSLRRYDHVKVETLKELEQAITEQLQPGSLFAVDCEGLDLGRYGALTILTIKVIDEGKSAMATPAYVLDIQLLGKAAFDVSDGFLKRMLESASLQKVMFDCRSDSDALWHQFRIKLTNVLDLQVYDQAVRIHRGGHPPARRGSHLPFVPPMRRVGAAFVERSDYELLREGADAPHKEDERVWGKRPLPEVAWQYAAADAHMIDLIFRAMKRIGVSRPLLLRVEFHSARYLNHFRERQTAVRNRHSSDKTFIMEEISILLDG